MTIILVVQKFELGHCLYSRH